VLLCAVENVIASSFQPSFFCFFSRGPGLEVAHHPSPVPESPRASWVG